MRLRLLYIHWTQNAEILLFGSYIRGNFRPDSDINILIISDIYGDNPHGYVKPVSNIK